MSMENQLKNEHLIKVLQLEETYVSGIEAIVNLVVNWDCCPKRASSFRDNLDNWYHTEKLLLECDEIILNCSTTPKPPPSQDGA